MSAQPKYVMQPDFDAALIAISGHIDHSALLSKAEIRREITESENRLTAKIEATKTELQLEIHASEERLQVQFTKEIQASEARLQTQINDMKEQIGHVETVGKANHQMLQIMLDQFSKISSQLSKINQKLGID